MGIQGLRHVVTATPSCKRVSSAGRMAVKPEKVAEIWSEVLAHVDAFCAVVRKTRPLLIMLENTIGLKRGYPDLYQEVQKRLLKLPYRWRHGEVEARDLGASHSRLRLGWVGVRKY